MATFLDGPADRKTANTSDPESLTQLCIVGADVGTRLVRLSKWVDGMPSTIKSLGFEIWAVCEILCELANIIARVQKTSVACFWNDEALKELDEHVERCEEVILEVAKAVMFAYERIKILKPQGIDNTGKKIEDQGDDGENEVDKIELTPQEKSKWPLFQRQTASLMEGLSESKMDLTLQVLVYWIAWEQENRRKSKTSIFNKLVADNRNVIVDQLWQNKLRRELTTDAPRIPGLSNASSSLSSPGGRTQSGRESPYSNRTPTFTNSDEGHSPAGSQGSGSESDDSIFRRMGRKLARTIGLRKRKERREEVTQHHDSSEGPQSINTRPTPVRGRSHSSMSFRSSSKTRTTSRDGTVRSSSRQGDNRQSRYADATPNRASKFVLPANQRAAHRVHSFHNENVVHRMSLLTLADPTVRIPRMSSFPAVLEGSLEHDMMLPASRPQLNANMRKSWISVPSKGAKDDIKWEWERFRKIPDPLKWENEEREIAPTTDPRELGRELLYRQLRGASPMWAVDDPGQVSASVDMLVENWIDPSHHSTRKREPRFVPKHRISTLNTPTSQTMTTDYFTFGTTKSTEEVPSNFMIRAH